MDSFKNFIEESRADFETDMLPSGHKERFLNKTSFSQSRKRIYTMRYLTILSAASVILLIITIPFFVNNRISSMNSGEYYSQILDKQSSRIEKMASNLRQDERLSVESTLNQLNEESVSLEDQLPPSISSRKRREIIKGYYSDKIDGADRLERYVQSLISD